MQSHVRIVPNMTVSNKFPQHEANTPMLAERVNVSAGGRLRLRRAEKRNCTAEATAPDHVAKVGLWPHRPAASLRPEGKEKSLRLFIFTIQNKLLD